MLSKNTPLWSADHLPHKGGDPIGARFAIPRKGSERRDGCRESISPLWGVSMVEEDEQSIQ